MRIIIFIILLIFNCDKTEIKDLPRQIHKKEKYLFIDWRESSSKNILFNKIENHREELFEKISRSRPKIIYYNFQTEKENDRFKKIFMSLDDNIKIVVPLTRDLSKEFDVEKYLGNKLPGLNSESSYHMFHEVKGIKKPLDFIINKSDLLCYGLIYTIEDSNGKSLGVSPYVKFDNKFIETCSFSVAKKILEKEFGIFTKFNLVDGDFMFNNKKDQNIIFTKFSQEYKMTSMFMFDLYGIKKIDLDQFLDSNFKLEENMIVFVGSSDKNLSDNYFDKLSGTEAEINFIYMFVNEVLMEFWNKYPEHFDN